MAHITRRNLLLLLLGIDGTRASTDGIGGITRLQKYLFLLEKEGVITPSGDGFEFAPYKAGPYSSKLYDDLEFLENLGLVESKVTGEATSEESAEIAKLSFEHLMGDAPDPEEDGADVYEEREFRLTSEGVNRVNKMLVESDISKAAEGIQKVKSKYSNYSLSDLLYHVYTKYPEMTTESEIRDQVLNRRGHRD